MKQDSRYTIRHINIRDLLHQPQEAVAAAMEYLVYWWDEIPLGHSWAGSAGHAGIGLPALWTAVNPALRAYSTRRLPEKDFEKLVERQGRKDHRFCERFLEELFREYAVRESHPGNDLSLIICTRNRTRHLKRCLDALGDLSLQPREVIVVDNAPDDSSTKELVAAFPGVTYVPEPGKGLDRARNAGWRHATSTLVAYSDDDVRLHRDFVWQTIRAFDHPRVKAVTGLVFADSLDTRARVIFEKYWSFNRGYRDMTYDAAYFKKHLQDGVPVWDIGAGANMAFRRAILQSLGGFDNRLDVGASGCSGDSEIWYRLLASGWSIHYAPRAVAYHSHRQEMSALKRQIYYYLRGNTSSLLVQYQRSRHKGNLRYLCKTLPAFFARSLWYKFRYPHEGKYATVFQEIAGSLSGVFYFMSHPKNTAEDGSFTFPAEGAAEPSVSVIITTYNHARFIGEAIESVLQQTVVPSEIIVIDDGSTDHTDEIVMRYPGVTYIRQSNQGLAAARNAAVFNSRGKYLVFLDADDLLYPHAVARNLHYFSRHPACAFISGGHDKVDGEKRLLETYEGNMPEDNHYHALLQGNYIGMHAAVMYRREVFDALLFDETLPACEDYDLYLRTAKRYPVFSHREKLAAYRLHTNNMSGDIRLMLGQAKAVLRKNADLSDQATRKYYRAGIKNWTAYYARETYRRIAYRYKYPGYAFRLRDLLLVSRQMPLEMTRFFIHKMTAMFGKKSNAPKKPGRINWGDLRRTDPVSKEFGYDRGGPVDRYYIENFLQENEGDIRGNVLEVGDNAYTMKYGNTRVTRSDILFIDDSNPQATIIGDLSAADHIPSDQFDCIVLTQTLHLIYDFHGAIKHCHRILKPGGVLLLTVPGITQIDYGEWGDTWYWSFTGRAILRLLSEYFDPDHLLVQTHGNVLAATAFLYGLGGEEITREEKEKNDPHYQVIITGKAVKSTVTKTEGNE